VLVHVDTSYTPADAVCLCVSGRLVPFVEHAVDHGSVLTILAITVERYWAVRDPLKVIGIQMLIIKSAITRYVYICNGVLKVGSD